MEKSEAIKETVLMFFKKVTLPLLLAGLALWLSFHFAKQFDEWYFSMIFWIAVGLPYGFGRVREWFMYNGPDFGSIAATIVLFLLQIAIAGLIGIPILAWRILCAIYYLIRVVINVIQIATGHEESVLVLDD